MTAVTPLNVAVLGAGNRAQDHLKIGAARRPGVKLEVAENVGRWPNERLKRQIGESGLIGRVTQVHLWSSPGSYHGINAARTLIGSPPVRARGFARETPSPPH